MTTSQVLGAARLVRVASSALAMSLMIGFIAVQAFVSRYGDPAGTVMLDASHTDITLSRAISVQAAAGLICADKPTLTDVVLFQHSRGDEVVVMTFDQAIEASAAHSGWIRRYCV